MNKNTTESDKDIFEVYSKRFKDENYAATYDKELMIGSTREIPFRRRLIGSIVANLEKGAVSRLLKKTIGNSIIDIPCGSGKLNSVLNDTGCKIVSADASVHMLKFAQENCSEKFEFLLCDIRFIPLNDKTIDVVISNRFLHRISAENHGIVLKELYRISRRYAILYFASKTVITSMVIKLEEFFNFGNRGEIYYLERHKIIEDLKKNNWRYIKSVRTFPLISTGYVFLVEKIDD